jgi:hypothetical protein
MARWSLRKWVALDTNISDVLAVVNTPTIVRAQPDLLFVACAPDIV